MKNFNIAFVIAFLFPFMLKAQEFWTTYNTAGSSIRSIAIDADGNKWFTGTSIYKFDNTNWTTYGKINTAGVISVSPISAVTIDAQGNKWFAGGSRDIYMFDDITWTLYNPTNTNGGFPLSWSLYTLVIDVYGDKWVGTMDGIGRFNGANGVIYTKSNTSGGLASNDVRSIAIDAQGNKWFGTSDGGVCKFHGTTWTTYNTNNSELANNDVRSIIIDAQGNKWFGTYGGGVSKFDGTNWTTYNTDNSGLADNSVQSIAIDAQGNKWFGTNSGGVSKFDGTTWTTYNTSNSGLADNRVQSIAIDAQGNKWIGTFSGGVSVLSNGPLALNLLAFNGKNTNTGNVLNWQTANENNHKGFAIERSNNGTAFTQIGFIGGRNTVEKQNYTYTDKQAPIGKSYYRLKMEDVNGTVEYSNVVVLENKLQSYITVTYPNPVKNQLVFKAMQVGEMLKIYNASGVLVLKQRIIQQESIVDVTSLVKGTYMFRYGKEQGKFVKE